MKLKIAIELGDGTWHAVPVETVWAEQSPGQTAVIENIPFFAKGISLGDLISFSTTQTSDGPLHHFESVIKPSGHSTYRVRVEGQDDNDIEVKLVAPLQQLGCLVERATHMGFRLFAVDIPATVDAEAAYAHIEQLIAEGHAEVEEGNDVHPS